MPKRSTKVEKGQVSLTTFFAPGSQTKSSKARKRQAATPRHNATLGESSQQKVRRKENKSPLASPQATPKRRSRRLSALGSETNIGTAGHATATSSEGGGPGQPGETSKHDEVIDLTDSPSADRIIKYGLPTPVTMPKRRAPPAMEPTPTPTHTKPGREALDLMFASRCDGSSPATPLARPSEPVAQQQPTPTTPSRSRPHALPQSIYSPLTSSKDSPRRRLGDIPASVVHEMMPTESQRLVPSSQTQDDNPFNTPDKEGQSKNTGSLFKIPQLPARFEDGSSPSRRTSTANSRSARFKVPTSPASARVAASSRMKETVCTSQPWEEELVYLSPGRSSSKWLPQYIHMAACSFRT